MLKKLLSSKKTVIAFVLVLALAATGATYAWFTSIGNGSKAIVDMGNLKVSTTLLPDALNPDIMEPGIEIRHAGTVDNLGSIPSIVMVDYSNVVTIKSDADGNPLGEWKAIIDDPNVNMAMDQSLLGWNMSGDDYYAWFAINGQPGKYALIMYGNVSVDIAYDIAFDGPGMGNEYQNANINFSDAWLATQVLDGAVEDVFGFGYGDLININNQLGGSGARMANSNGDYETILASIEALFNR